jgi:hypothetical protein
MHFYLDRKGPPPKIKLWEFFYGEGGDEMIVIIALIEGPLLWKLSTI